MKNRSRLKLTDKKNKIRDETYGFMGATLCFLVAGFDVAWRPFWLVVGFVLMLSSLYTLLLGKRPR